MGVVGPRRLALVVEPGDGESLHSWVDRMAARNRCPPGVMVGLLELPMGERELRWPGGRPLAFGIVSTPAGRAGIEAATGVGADAVRAMHLEAFDGSALCLGDLVVGDRVAAARIAVREWALFSGTRACPVCLSESGGVWLTWWKLGWAAACPRHRMMLIDCCPTCGAPLRQGHKTRTCGLSVKRASEPAVCLAALGRGVYCGQDLSVVAAVRAAPAVVAVQERMLEIAGGGEERVGGQSVTGREFFAAMRLIAVLVRLGLPASLEVFDPVAARAHEALLAEARSRSHSQGGPATSTRVPSSAWAAAGLAGVCLRVLDAADPVDLAGRIGALVAAAEVGRWGSRLGTVMSGDEPAVLVRAVRQVRLHPTAKVLRGARPRAGWAFQACHLPRLAPCREYRELTASLLAQGTGELRGRRFVAMAAARRALELETWAAAGEHCGLGGAHALGIAGHCGGGLRDPGAFWEAIDTALDRLAQGGPVDFEARRGCLARLRTVPEQDWRVILRGTGTAVTPKRACNAAAWLWEELTCGGWREAPAALDPTHGVSIDDRRRVDAFKIFCNWLPPLVEARLREYGQQVLGDAGVG
jgi:hypothetical protein